MAETINQRIAARLLDVRARGGYSLCIFLRWNAKRYSVVLVYTISAVAFFAFMNYWGLCLLLIGLFVGVWLREFGYMRSAIKAWPFFSAVTNWENVQRIADGDLII
jgi:hypothetical protein